MKKKQCFFCGVLLLFCIMCTGCGTKLYALTEEEENKIVLYSAKMVSKYNRAQDTGYCYVTQQDEEDETGGEDTNPEKPAEQSEEPEATLSDVMAVEGLQITYQGYDVSSEYVTSDVALPAADEGYSYLILHFQVSNTTQQEMQVDLLSNPASYMLSLNQNVNAEGLSTLSMEDLSTYYNRSLNAGDTADTVLLFQIKTEYLAEITNLELQVERQGQTYHITLL